MKVDGSPPRTPLPPLGSRCNGEGPGTQAVSAPDLRAHEPPWGLHPHLHLPIPSVVLSTLLLGRSLHQACWWTGDQTAAQRGEAWEGSVPTPARDPPGSPTPLHLEGGLSGAMGPRAAPGVGPSRAPPAGGDPRRREAPRGVAENLLLFITRARPAAPVNTFLQRVMHRRLTAGAAPPARPPRTWGWA